MESCYQTPGKLVEALHQHGEGARGHLWHLLREPVGRLLAELVARDRTSYPLEMLTVHALHLAETWLRTRPTGLFVPMGWQAFRAAVLMQVAKFASSPFGKEGDALAGPLPLPECPWYQTRALLWPHERVGRYWFGGDWFAGVHAGDGSLWVILADITGHGYYAYLLASSLPGVWEACWERLETSPAQPADVLRVMHEILADCLPEGVFAECTLVRLSEDGEVTVGPAGGTRLLLRKGGVGQPDLVRLRGTWLGLSPPSPADQRSWVLSQGDELLLATDGLFDHLLDADGALTLEEAEGAALFDLVEQRLRQVLRAGPQKDDITAVMLSRRNGVPVGGQGAPRGGDVPV
jgi:hypothetical protein